MAIEIDGDGYDFSVTEWWDGDGDWHDGSPSWTDMEDGNVSGFTGHIEYDDGTEKWFDYDMEDQNRMGFDIDEFVGEIDDSADRYSEAS